MSTQSALTLAGAVPLFGTTAIAAYISHQTLEAWRVSKGLAPFPQGKGQHAKTLNKFAPDMPAAIIGRIRIANRVAFLSFFAGAIWLALRLHQN